MRRISPRGWWRSAVRPMQSRRRPSSIASTTRRWARARITPWTIRPSSISWGQTATTSLISARTPPPMTSPKTSASASQASESELPFWRRKKLAEMTREEWESLCDGCAKCCLVKLEYEDTGKVDNTDIACRLLDAESCRCSDYSNRQKRVSDCLALTPRRVRRLRWLPSPCAYRLVAEGRDLYWWHPLVSGDPNTVHEAGVSGRGRVGGTEGGVSARAPE